MKRDTKRTSKKIAKPQPPIEYRKLNAVCPDRGIEQRKPGCNWGTAVRDGFNNPDDSMFPVIHPCDWIAYEPADRMSLRNGDVVVIEMKTGGRLVRRFYDEGATIRLTAENPLYAEMTVPRDEIKAAYPVEEIHRKLYQFKIRPKW